MSSSSSARVRVLRGVSFERAFSPLETELPGPPVEVDPVVAAAEERRGYDDGYRAGLAEGLAAGRAALAAESAAHVARLEGVIRALNEAAADLRRRQALELAGLEDTLARTAVDLASAIIGRELQVAESPGADALARALALVPAGATAIARLNPADAALLDGARPSSGLIAPDSACGGPAGAGPAAPIGVTIVPDPAIEAGGCILEVGDSRIDAQLGSALDRVRAALLGDRP
jgi:flagellar assembly protein FliH